MGFWLMKNEPDCYGIDDLERDGTNLWEGCRNYTVRNYFRDAMQVGDLALFYHSNADPSGLAGLMEIVSEAQPDPTQFDPNSEYFDPKSPGDNPRWLAREVRFLSKFPRVVTIAELRATPGLEDLHALRKGNRLSITPVTPEEWAIVMGLVEKI